LRTTSTIALLVMLSFQFIFLFNFVWSLRKGKSAGANPWRSATLEWTVPSPPPHGNFAEMPTVYRGPYEYGLLGRSDDFLPQNVPDQALGD
jgi:cytochrome c oxidase subunit 1